MSDVTRRSALTAAAAAGVGVGIGVVYGKNSDAADRPPKPGGDGYGGGDDGYGNGNGDGGPQLIAKLSDVPDGGGLITSRVVLTRGPGDTVQAYSSQCTHQGCEVNKVSGGQIFCPCHGSVFDANTGAVRQGPAAAPLTPVQVTVKNGGVYTA